MATLLNFSEEFGGGEVQEGVAPGGGGLSHWLEHKGAQVHARVREGQFLAFENNLVNCNEVYIKLAVAIGPVGVAVWRGVDAALYFLQTVQKPERFYWRHFNCHTEVHELVRRFVAPWRAPVRLRHAYPGAREFQRNSGDSLPHKGKAVAAVGAYVQVGDHSSRATSFSS